MNQFRLATITLAAAALLPSMAYSQNNHGDAGDLGKQHVLLISIDGMHALDYENCVRNNTCPTLKALGVTGVNYTRTSTAKPSDSFPGLMALVTGGTPKTVGAFYDVAYDRVLAPPSNPLGTWNGLNGGTCTPGHANGTRTEYEEGVDLDPSKLTGGSPFYTNPIDGGWKSIDPTRLPRDPYDNCNPVYPWNFVRTNTIYGVIHKAGGYTAWSDKHAVYAAVSGPTGTSTPSNVDDYYAPDVNSNVVPLAGLTTAYTNDNCGALVNNGDAWTDHFVAIRCYDQLKVNAVVNWIKGKTHLGGGNAPVPTIFGMNFQAVSVGQKLIEGKVTPGGYTDAAGDTTSYMLAEIQFVDAAIGQMVAALSSNHLLESTTIIVTAKHGQSPIDVNRNVRIPGPTGTPATNDGFSPASYLKSYLPDSEFNQIGPTEDDISLLWLNHSSDTATAVGILETAGSTAGIGQIFYGPSITTMYNAPSIPPAGPCCKYSADADPRSPDIIVQPNVGVVYSGSQKKHAEHGGFAHDDTNVMLLVSNPNLKAKTVTTFVETTQVAPTILQILGLDPSSLDAVRIEGTDVLPGFEAGQSNRQ